MNSFRRWFSAYAGDLRRSRLATRAYVAVTLALAAIFVAGRALAPDTRRLERLMEKRLSEGHRASAEWYAAIWEPRAAVVNAVLCMCLAACWPLVERRLESRGVTA